MPNIGEMASGALKATKMPKSALKATKMPKKMGEALSGVIPGNGDNGGGGDGGEDGLEAHGSGRRMPLQQAVDIAVPLRDVYNLWIQFEDWPTYMHRVESAEQLDRTTVGVDVKVWGINRHFQAEIVEQIPDQRIEWDATEGLSHTGVVTFHQLAPRLTRVEVTVDVKPQGLLEKAGRGMRFAKRAIRGDLHRFKAHAEIAGESDGGWRGTIEDGKVKRKKPRKARK